MRFIMKILSVTSGLLISTLCSNSWGNFCPIASGQNLTVKSGGSVSFQLSASDPEGDPLQFTITQPPLHGAVVTSIQTGAGTYTPTPGYAGPDAFAYKVNDGACDSAPAQVSILVSNNCPTASGQNLTVKSGGSVSFQLSASDPDGDPLHFIVTQPPLHGAVVTSSQTGAGTYTPAPGYAGPDAFAYKVNDGVCDSAPATISILVSNNCPTASGQNLTVATGGTVNFQLSGSDPDGDPLHFIVTQPPLHGVVVTSIQTGAGTYTPAPGFTGPDSFKFTVSDGPCQSAAATVSITVASPNQPPIARIVGSPLADFSPYLPNPVLIAANGSNACVVLDGSTSSDPETPANELSYSWLLQPSPTPFATGVRATNCVDLATYTYVLTVTDPQGGSGTASLTIDVLTPCEAEGALILIIQNSGLPRNVQQPLISSVKAACASYEKFGTSSGANQLQAFQSKVRTHVRPIDLALAQQLNDAAQVIIDALNGL